MDSRTGGLSALAVAAAVATVASGQTTVMYVDDDAPAGGDGTTWNKAYRDLQDALDSARAKHLTGSIEVRIAEGIYTPDRGTLDRTKFFNVGISTTSSITCCGCPLVSRMATSR